MANYVDLTGATFSDPDSPTAFALKLVAGAGTLTATSGGGVTVAGSGTGTLTLTGTLADIATFLQNSSNLQYTGPANAEGDNYTTLSVYATDGQGSGEVAVGTVNIDLNLKPTVAGLPSDLSFAMSTAGNLDLSAATLADADSTGSGFALTLSAGAGTFSATSGGGVTVGGSGTATLTLTGTVSAIDTFLNTAANVQYTPPVSVQGNDYTTVTVTANDQNGGGAVTLGTVNVDINYTTVASGDTLNVTANLTSATLENNGTLNVTAGTITVPSTITNNATMNVTGAADINGNVNNSSGATLNFSASGSLGGLVTNDGTIYATTGATNINQLVNNGTIDIASGVILTGAYNNDPQMNAGSFLQGNGTFKTALDASQPILNFKGTWNPGTDGTVGTLTMDTWDGSFGRTVKMWDTTVYNADIAGPSAGQYDKLVMSVANPITFDGTLNVQLASGYTPTDGDSYDILTWAAASHVGTFATYTGLDDGNGFILTPTYDDGTKKLTVTAHAVTHDTAVSGTISGTAGADTIRSWTSAETLDAGLGNDILSGNDGADVLFGGGGIDIMIGGTGSDIFKFTTASDSAPGSRDVILDFDATDDNEDILLEGFLTGGKTFSYVGTGAFTGGTNSFVEVRFDNATKILSVDTDGDGTSNMDVELHGVASTDLDTNDFTAT